MIKDLEEIENTIEFILHHRVIEIGYEDDEDSIIQACKEVLELPLETLDYEPEEGEEVW